MDALEPRPVPATAQENPMPDVTVLPAFVSAASRPA